MKHLILDAIAFLLAVAMVSVAIPALHGEDGTTAGVAVKSPPVRVVVRTDWIDKGWDEGWRYPDKGTTGHEYLSRGFSGGDPWKRGTLPETKPKVVVLPEPEPDYVKYRYQRDRAAGDGEPGQPILVRR